MAQVEQKRQSDASDSYESPFLGPIAGKLGEHLDTQEDDPNDMMPRSQGKKLQDYANRKLPVVLDVSIFLM